MTGLPALYAPCRLEERRQRDLYAQIGSVKVLSGSEQSTNRLHQRSRGTDQTSHENGQLRLELFREGAHRTRKTFTRFPDASGWRNRTPEGRSAR